ncbi:MAG: hypothetical protein ACTSR2_13310 [Candidatus Hodarchaeales archaeon]
MTNNTDEKNYWVFNLTMYHVIETTDYYIRNNPKGMPWGERGQIDWKSTDPLELKIAKLTKTLIKTYHEEVKNKTTKKLEGMSDFEFYLSDEFSWFSTILEKYLYLLRHNMMHIGELNKSLRDWQLKRIEWQ